MALAILLIMIDYWANGGGTWLSYVGGALVAIPFTVAVGYAFYNSFSKDK